VCENVLVKSSFRSSQSTSWLFAIVLIVWLILFRSELVCLTTQSSTFVPSSSSKKYVHRLYGFFIWELSSLFIQNKSKAFINFCVLVLSPSNDLGTFPFKLPSILSALLTSLFTSTFVVVAIVDPSAPGRPDLILAGLIDTGFIRGMVVGRYWVLSSGGLISSSTPIRLDCK
jgi:hypothetical protein